jgi:hypothetical protein
MVTQILKKVRLTWFFVFFLCLYSLLAIGLPQQKFDSGALTLFSVNSFLYGFYLAPILSAQKSRIEDLHKTVRAEANEIFAMALKLKKLSTELRNRLQKSLMEYIQVSAKERKAAEGEKQYEELITFCVQYQGSKEDEVEDFLGALTNNQKNRTQFSMLMGNKVYAHEWMVILVLFSITLGFVLLLEIGDSAILILVKALLCTGLSMLLVILAKLSTLTHKKAKQIWDPFKKLASTHFYRID